MKICDVAFSPYTLRIPPSYALIRSSRNTEKGISKYWTERYEKTLRIFIIIRHFVLSHACADPERGPTLDNLILVDEGIEDPNTTKSDQYHPASETQFKWRFSDESMVAQYLMLTL